MTYTKHAVEYYLTKYPDAQRITLDLNTPGIIIAYSKGEKDTIKLRRKI